MHCTVAQASHSVYPVSKEALRDIQRALSAPLFRGIPIGATLADIYVSLNLGSTNWGTTSAFKERLRCWYHSYWRPPGDASKVPTDKGRILVTWNSVRRESQDLVLPVLKSLGPEQCLAVGPKGSLPPHVPSESHFVSWDETFTVDIPAWRREYRGHAQAWKESLRGALNRNGLPSSMMPHFEDALIIQSQRMMASEELLDRLKPSAVLTDFDLNLRSSCLVLAAKSRGIPTMTMMHGVVNSHHCLMTPVIADSILCWGRRHRDQLIGLGVEPARLRIVGCQRLSRRLSVTPQAARTKVGLPADKPVVLLVTNPILPGHKRKLARVFCEGLMGCDQMSAAVRLHPSEKLDEYAREINAFPRVKFLPNEAWTLDEALAAADVVVCHNSGFGNDALIKGKPAVVLDVIEIPLSNGRDLVDNARCPCVRSVQELAQVVTSILRDPDVRRRLKASAERYVKGFCAAFGEDAAKNVAAEVLRKVEPSCPRSVIGSRTLLCKEGAGTLKS